MNKITTKKIVLNGLMIALVFLTTYFTRIPGPVPPGYINFGDIVIMLAAALLGRKSGFIAGSIGSAIADIASPGGIIFAPVTFIVKGVEGYITGLIAHTSKDKMTGEIRKIIAVVIGAAVMVAGYFAAEWQILSLIDKSFGYSAAITELPLNLVQGGVSAAAGYVLLTVLTRVGIRKVLR